MPSLTIFSLFLKTLQHFLSRHSFVTVCMSLLLSNLRLKSLWTCTRQNHLLLRSFRCVPKFKLCYENRKYYYVFLRKWRLAWFFLRSTVVNQSGSHFSTQRKPDCVL
jgi:hypothetical protein